MVRNYCASTESSKWCVRKMRSLSLSSASLTSQWHGCGTWHKGGVETIYGLNSKRGFKWLSTWTSGPCEFRMQNNHEFCLSLIPVYSMWSESCSVVSKSLRPHGLYRPWNSPGQNTRVGSLSLLQGLFPTQGSNPGLPHCRQILYQLSNKESSRILEWVEYPFSNGSFWPRSQTRVSCIAGGFFTSWDIREALHTICIRSIL